MAWYRTGTVSVTNGSTTVTGSGTNFVAGAQVGEGFAAPDGRLYEIVTIVSATSLTIGKAYLGSTQTGQTYEIVPTQSLVADLAGQVSTLISDFQSVADEAGEGKFDYGTAASPGITFTLDQDTGFFHDTNNEIGVSAGGTKVAEFNSGGLSVTGNVTAATANINGNFRVSSVGPIIEMLDVNAGVDNGLWDIAVNNGPFDVRAKTDAGAGGGGFFRFTRSVNNVQTLQGYRSAILRTELSGWDSHLLFSNAIGTIGTATAHDLVVDTNNAERMRVTPTGSVGIGTSNPRSQVHIYGAGQATADLADAGDMGGILRVSATGTTVGSGGGIIFANLQSDDTQTAGMAAIKSLLQNGENNTTGSLAFSLRAVNTDTALTERMRVTPTGSVGIGTDSPAYRLDVSSTSGAIARFINGSSGGTPSTTHGEIIVESGDANMGLQLLGTNTSNQKILFGDVASSGAGQIEYSHASNYMALFTGATERLRIDASGHAIIPGGVTLGTAAGVYNADNTLDDYEEGTWTPEFIPATGAFGSITYAFNTGTYTKVGRLVTVTGRIQVSGTPPTIGTAGANCYLSGFPFVIASGQNFYGAMSLTFLTGWSDSFAPSSAYISQGSSIAVLMKRPVSNNKELVFTPADFISGGANSGLMFTGTYFTN
jgi:hypothetical protein